LGGDGRVPGDQQTAARMAILVLHRPPGRTWLEDASSGPIRDVRDPRLTTERSRRCFGFVPPPSRWPRSRCPTRCRPRGPIAVVTAASTGSPRPFCSGAPASSCDDPTSSTSGRPSPPARRRTPRPPRGPRGAVHRQLLARNNRSYGHLWIHLRWDPGRAKAAGREVPRRPA
jgi:hypothetical protein